MRKTKRQTVDMKSGHTSLSLSFSAQIRFQLNQKGKFLLLVSLSQLLSPLGIPTNV
jgi:hypothetical protein